MTMNRAALVIGTILTTTTAIAESAPAAIANLFKGAAKESRAARFEASIVKDVGRESRLAKPLPVRTLAGPVHAETRVTLTRNSGISGTLELGEVNIRRRALAPHYKAKVDPSKELREFNKIVYPPRGGFQGPIKRATIPAGTIVDRFGGSWGRYVSPFGTGSAMRSLPPGPRTYHAYLVLKPIRSASGEAGAFFGEIGNGAQYKLRRSVEFLKDNGFLRHMTARDSGFARGNFNAQAEASRAGR
jgi:hypothetical protein